jgi:hypothetical protein
MQRLPIVHLHRPCRWFQVPVCVPPPRTRARRRRCCCHERLHGHGHGHGCGDRVSVTVLPYTRHQLRHRCRQRVIRLSVRSRMSQRYQRHLFRPVPAPPTPLHLRHRCQRRLRPQRRPPQQALAPVSLQEGQDQVRRLRGQAGSHRPAVAQRCGVPARDPGEGGGGRGRARAPTQGWRWRCRWVEAGPVGGEGEG